MNRREFLQTTGFAAGAAVTGLPALGNTYRYPMIGQPIYSCIFTNEVWKYQVLPRLRHTKNIIKTDPFGSTRIEVLFKKREGPFPEQVHLPAAAQYGAEHIIDAEIYSVLKNRSTGELGYLHIPAGANKTLVMENRRKYENSL